VEETRLKVGAACIVLAAVCVRHQANQPAHCIRVQGDSWLRLFCAVRTAEIDHQIQQALQQAGVRQMVLLGE
jgi:O-methyltransferase involved in polyketide biosynthesis